MGLDNRGFDAPNAYIVDLTASSINGLIDGDPSAINQFYGITNAIPKFTQRLTPRAQEEIKTQLSRILLPTLTHISAEFQLLASTTYLSFYEGATHGQLEPEILNALRSNLPLESDYILFSVLKDRPGKNLPNKIKEGLIAPFTISPDTMGDPENKRKFREHFKSGDIFLLDRTEFTGEDLDKLCFIPSIGYGVEVALDYTPALQKYFYYIGHDFSVRDSSDAQRKIRNELVFGLNHGVSVDLHTHPIPILDPSPEDKRTAFKLKEINPDCRAFIGGFSSFGNKYDLSFVEYNTWGRLSETGEINASQMADIMNSLVQKSV